MQSAGRGGQAGEAVRAGRGLEAREAILWDETRESRICSTETWNAPRSAVFTLACSRCSNDRSLLLW